MESPLGMEPSGFRHSPDLTSNEGSSVVSVRSHILSIALVMVASLIGVSFLEAKEHPSSSPDRSHPLVIDECVVRFAAEVKVPALETGRIDEVTVRLNDPIRVGHSIARLDDHRLLVRRRSAQLRVTSAQDQANDEIEIRYAEVALDEAKAELENSRSIQSDVRGAVPMTQMRRLRLAVKRGELEVAQARQRKQRAEVEVQLREADLSVIDDQLRNLHIESPADGVVLEVTHEAGEWIEKGQTIAKIGRISQLHVHALVHSGRVPLHRCKDLPVSVHWADPVDGSQRSLSGRVLSIDPQSLPGHRYRLHA